VAPDAADYLDPERAARIEIDEMLADAGWVVQDYKAMALGAALGIAVREFPMAPGHGIADYLLFIDRVQVGAYIDGDGLADHSGHSVAIRSDGETIIIGAVGADGRLSRSRTRPQRYLSAVSSRDRRQLCLVEQSFACHHGGVDIRTRRVASMMRRAQQ
jgi:hypothetical protein